MSEEKVHLKVMVHHINLACGLWPNYYHGSSEQRPWTKDKSKVTCGRCKLTKAYKIDNFSLADIIDDILNKSRK